MRGPGGWSERLQYAGLAALTLATIVLCYLALKGDPQSTSASDQDSVTSVGAAPQVADALRADFAAGDPLPDDAQVFDNSANATGLAVTDGALRHGEPIKRRAVGSLEVELPDDATKIGATVEFPDKEAGSVGLMVFQSSFVAAREAGDPPPASGLRLVVTPSAWRLTVWDGNETLLRRARYTAPPGPRTFELVRRGSAAWVVAPDGTTTAVNNPVIEQYAGPWACWQLIEDRTTLRPAAVDAIWAG